MEVDKNLAVLTRADSGFGLEFLNRLASKGVKPSLLCVEHTSFSKRIKMAKFLAKKIGWLDAARYNTKFWLPLLQRKISFGYWKQLPVFDDFAQTIISCQDINEQSVVNALTDSSITKIVLAQSGIIRKSILNLNKWIINCHPGRLPDFRGVDVIRWALLQRQPVEITLHLVEPGIDTGAVLTRFEICISSDDTINSVVDKTISKSLDILVDAAIAGPAGFPNPLPQDKSQGKQYYLMPFNLVVQLEKDWQKIINFYTQ